MIQAHSSQAEDLKENSLPLRDWIVMPLLMLITIFAVGWAFETISKKQFTQPVSGRSRCTPYLDPWIGVKRPADCTYVETSSDGRSTEYHLNDHGYREDASLSPKKPGVFRIVMVGTSFGISSGSPKAQTIADLLQAGLSQRTGRPVELYNESIEGFPGLPQSLVRRFDDVLAAQPDLILWQMTRWDIKADDMTVPEEEGAEGQAAGEPQHGDVSNAGQGPGGMLSALSHPVKLAYSIRALYLGSHSASLLNNLLNQSQSQLISTSLNGPDTIMGYLKADRSELWAQRDMRFDAQLAEVAAKAKAAHVPLILTIFPTNVQVAMVSSGEWPAMYNPYRLEDDLRAIAANHNVGFVDTLPDFRKVTNPERGYRLGDGHPNPNGNRMLASFLVDELTKGVVPALRPETPSGTVQERAQ